MDFSKDVVLAIQAAQAAGKIIKQGYRKKITTETKSDRSLVTNIDQSAERVIIDLLEKNSDHAIMSEESDERPGSSGLTWVIDPIDGTTNFFRKQKAFAVSIALMRETESVLGVVFNPLTNDIYYAEQNKGAFLNKRVLHVAQESEPIKSIIFFNYGSDYEHRETIAHVVRRLIQKFDLRIWGTTALEMCTVALGTCDAFICVGDKLWDYAAAMLIVKEAGGLFTDWFGAPWNGKNSYILAAQPKIQHLIISCVKDLQK